MLKEGNNEKGKVYILQKLLKERLKINGKIPH
jgi:hypothetical protein